MRIHVLSDIHLLGRGFSMPKVKADLIVCAGDLDEGFKGLSWLNENAPNWPVIYVLGNHEYYGQSFAHYPEQIRQLASGSNVQVLENEELVLAGVRFLGCTLWTDFQLLNTPEQSMFESRVLINDFRRIHSGGSTHDFLKPADVLKAHIASRAWLTEKLAEPRVAPTVVITHHSPSIKSLPGYMHKRLTSAACASALDELVEQSQAALWIHGHVHRISDYRIGGTRVLCNPRGYLKDEGNGFRPELVVEV